MFEFFVGTCKLLLTSARKQVVFGGNFQTFFLCFVKERKYHILSYAFPILYWLPLVTMHAMHGYHRYHLLGFFFRGLFWSTFYKKNSRTQLIMLIGAHIFRRLPSQL